MVKIVHCPEMGVELFGDSVYGWPMPDEKERPKRKPPKIVEDVKPLPRKRISVGKKI